MLPTSTLIRLFGTTLRLSRHDRWTPEQLRAHQARSLHRLRCYAYRYSPFYQRFHAGDFDAPLEALPVLTSRDLGAELESMLTPAGGTRRECRTSGTAGEHVRRCVYDARAWRTVLASFARARAWAGVPVRPSPRVRMAVVASGSPVHQSGAVAAALDNWWAPTLSLDAGAPLDLLVARLNAWRPDVMVAYPSTACALAGEQQTGRLQVQPRLVVSVAEVLSREARERLEEAWRCPVVNQYATTEMGCLAAECSLQTGLHLQEDLAIVEVVDEHDRPVPPGQTGEKILLTVLCNFAMPLIRYEISDRVVLAADPCPCGRPFRLLERIEGRHEELVRLPGVAGLPVVVHPVALYEVLDALPLRGWSLAVGPQEIGVRVIDGDRVLDDSVIVARIGAAVRRRGALPPPIRIEHVTDIARTGSRKRVAMTRGSMELNTMAKQGHDDRLAELP